MEGAALGTADESKSNVSDSSINDDASAALGTHDESKINSGASGGKVAASATASSLSESEHDPKPSPRVVQKLNDAIKLAAQLDDQEPETKTTSKVDGDKDTDPENAISEDEDQVTEDAAADNALVQSLVQDFARGAAAKASTLTKAERDQQNVERVIAYTDEEIAADPTDFYSNFQAGYVHEVTKNYERASGHFKASFDKSNGEDLDTIYHLATTCQHQGRIAEALHYNMMLDPTKLPAHMSVVALERAGARLALEDLDKGIEVLRRLAQQTPFDPHVFHSLAAALYQRGTLNCATASTAPHSAFPVAPTENADVHESMRLWWELENRILGRYPPRGRWQAGAPTCMAHDLDFMRDKFHWRRRNAATLIQTAYRGHFFRQFVIRYRIQLIREEKEDEMSVLMQKQIRILLARRLVERILAMRAKHATIIQAAVRGGQDRARLRHRLEKKRFIIVFYFPLDIEQLVFVDGKPEWKVIYRRRPPEDENSKKKSLFGFGRKKTKK